jgi:predicted nucleic acid-binding protein
VKLLADTSVWIRHFRGRTTALQALLQEGLIVMHPWVRLELALGTPPRRAQTLAWLAQMEMLPLATLEELENFIERRGLHDQGIGLVDAALLASVLLRPGTRLWTFDKALDALAAQFGCAHQA